MNVRLSDNKPPAQRFNGAPLRGHAHVGIVIEHLFRQMPRDALHGSFGNSGFRHLCDALVAKVMEPEAVERFRCTPARRVRIGPGFKCQFHGFVTSPFCGCLDQTSPRGSEGLLIPGKTQLAVLARRKNEIFRRATAKSIGSPLGVGL